jgi:hypothetical protein
VLSIGSSNATLLSCPIRNIALTTNPHMSVYLDLSLYPESTLGENDAWESTLGEGYATTMLAWPLTSKVSAGQDSES